MRELILILHELMLYLPVYKFSVILEQFLLAESVLSSGDKVEMSCSLIFVFKINNKDGVV